MQNHVPHGLSVTLIETPGRETAIDHQHKNRPFQYRPSHSARSSAKKNYRHPEGKNVRQAVTIWCLKKSTQRRNGIPRSTRKPSAWLSNFSEQEQRCTIA